MQATQRRWVSRHPTAGGVRLALQLLIALGALGASFGSPGSWTQADAPAYRYHLPIAARQQPGCDPSPAEQALASLMAGDPEQRRPLLRCNRILEQVARQHAADMATRGYVGYVTPEGLGMNDLLRNAGYLLPDAYNRTAGANEVASIAVGYGWAHEAWAGLTNPIFGAQPRTHVLGLHPFFARQIDYGVGYVHDPASLHGHYWVIIAAEPLYWPGELVRPALQPTGAAPLPLQRVIISAP